MAPIFITSINNGCDVIIGQKDSRWPFFFFPFLWKPCLILYIYNMFDQHQQSIINWTSMISSSRIISKIYSLPFCIYENGSQININPTQPIHTPNLVDFIDKLMGCFESSVSLNFFNTLYIYMCVYILYKF